MIDDHRFGSTVTVLEEECSEVIKEICKGRRFGQLTGSPKDGSTPRGRLICELADLVVAIALVKSEHAVAEEFEQALDAKFLRLQELYGSAFILDARSATIDLAEKITQTLRGENK